MTPGFEVVGEAETGEAAVEWSRPLEPTLVLMDINMAGHRRHRGGAQDRGRPPRRRDVPHLDLRGGRPSGRAHARAARRRTSTRRTSRPRSCAGSGRARRCRLAEREPLTAQRNRAGELRAGSRAPTPRATRRRWRPGGRSCSRSRRRAAWRAVSKPAPSSVTSKTSRPPSSRDVHGRRRPVARVLAAFCSASRQQK